MKRKYLLGVLAVTLYLSACSLNDSNVDNMLREFETIDLDISKEWDGINYSSYSSDYGESAQGFYYYDALKNTMMYISKDVDKAIPLCTKVECVHGAEIIEKRIKFPEYTVDCNAVYEGNTGIQIYNGKLYADISKEAGISRAIICAELDGTNRSEVVENIAVRIEEEQTLPDKTGEVFMASVKWFIADDMIYTVKEVHVEDGTKILGRVYVDVYDLSTGEISKELFYKEYEVEDLIPSYLYVDAEHIYIAMHMYVGEEMESSIQFMELDKNTGECKEINFGKDRNYKGYIYADDKIIFGKEEGDVYTLDIDGSEQMCIELEEDEKKIGMFYKKEGNYILLTIREAVKLADGSMGYYSKIYDEKYNYLDTVYHTEDITTIAGGTNELLFKNSMDDKFYLLDVDDIGTGNIELVEVEMPKVKKSKSNK